MKKLFEEIQTLINVKHRVSPGCTGFRDTQYELTQKILDGLVEMEEQIKNLEKKWKR